MQRVKLLENVSAKKKKNTYRRSSRFCSGMVRVKHDASDNAAAHCYITVRVRLSATGTRQAVAAVGRIRVEKSRGLGQTADEAKHTWHNAQGRKLGPTVSDVARNFIFLSKNQPQGCCSSCGRHARDKCFCCILSAGGKAGGRGGGA